ncbi:MAG: FISUMP domain-containing protein [Fibrobacteraceae bacterium]
MTGFFIKIFIAFFTVLFAISCSENSVTDPDDLAASTWGSGSSSSDTSMVFLSGECFEMGSTDGSNAETPVHKVCVSDFSIDRHEVTNAEYIAAMGDSAHFDDNKCGIFNADSGQSFSGALPASFRGSDQPMVCVDWSQAEAYCERQGKRLPTEAEWEYAARAGRTTDYFWGSVVTGGCAYGNIADKTKLSDGNSWSDPIQCTDGYGEVTSPVESFSPSPWGLYDMTGNVWEWTHDWYDSSYYAVSPAANPWGPSSGTYRVNRGGAWNSLASWLRVSARNWVTPDYSDNALGFRCVASNATPGSASSFSSSSYGVSSSSVYTNTDISYGSFMDIRDSMTYRTVVIGTQTWMAENLNYETRGSWCYEDKESNCSKYGRLYSWAEAMGLSSSYNKSHWGGSDVNRQGICPSGWHLPSDSEWTVLANYVSKTSNMGNMNEYGSWSAIGQLLKSGNGWHDTTSAGKGTNAFGFTALAAGALDSSSFFGENLFSGWWSSTENEDDDAIEILLFYSDDSLSRGTNIKSYDFSVRCVMDPSGISSSVNSSSSGGLSSSAIGSSSSGAVSSSSVGISSSSNPVSFRDTSFSIAENAKTGTLVGKLFATDDSSSKLTWSLVAGTTFSLDSNQLILKESLDYEKDSVYQFRAVVVDAKKFTDTATITVHVTNVNEKPVFADTSISIAETAANGAPVGKLAASDPDGNTLTYSLISTSGIPFTLSDNGQLSVAAALDYNADSLYVLKVVASDGKLSDTAQVSVHILDVNTAPVFRDTTFSIAEDAKIGTLVGTLQATDDSKGKLTWVLINETMFSLDSNRLILNGSLDYEGTFIYQLRVFVRDEGKLSDTATITVQVTNVNEAPVFTEAPDTLSEANGLGTGTVLDTLKASDPDGDIFVFFIRSGNTDNMFGLTSEGVLKLTGTLDYATTPVYNLVVAVTDGSDTVSSLLTVVVDSSRFIDPRDGHIYKSVKIGTQTWMAENLAYLPQVDSIRNGTTYGYYVYNYTPSSYTESEQVRIAKGTSNYKTYGVLYSWKAAMTGAASNSDAPSGVQGVCPSGWHLPSTAEWSTLHAYVDLNNGDDGDGYSLKAKTGWNSSGNGSDQFGFSALPGGYCTSPYYNASFVDLGSYGYWWSSTASGDASAYVLYISTSAASLSSKGIDSNYGYSIRCVQDSE